MTLPNLLRDERLTAVPLESLRPEDPEHEYAESIMERGERADDLNAANARVRRNRSSAPRCEPERYRHEGPAAAATVDWRRISALNVTLEPSYVVWSRSQQVHQVRMKSLCECRGRHADGGRLTIATAKTA